MSETTLRLTPAAGPSTRRAALLALGCVLLAPHLARAQDALPFAKSYSITGNYVVGGVDLPSRSRAKGLVTGSIPMSGVPANADILAAFLYWETISTDIAQVDGAKFRGSPITVVKASSMRLNPPTAACWSSGADRVRGTP